MTGVSDLPDCMIFFEWLLRDMLSVPGRGEHSGEHLSSKGHAGTGDNGTRQKRAVGLWQVMAGLCEVIVKIV